MLDFIDLMFVWLLEAIIKAFYYFIPKALYPGESFYWKYTGVILLSIVTGLFLWGNYGNNDQAWIMAWTLMLWVTLHPILRWDRVKNHRK